MTLPTRARAAQGYVLVTALVMMTVLALLTTIILSGSTSGLQQAGSYSGLIAARAGAEAGQAQAAYVMSEQLVPGINAVLLPYATEFSKSKNDASKDAIVPASAFTSVLSSLNTLAGLQQSGAAGGSTYTAATLFRNFRSDAGSFSAQGQQYYVDYTVTSIGKIGPFSRTLVADGSLRISMGRQYLSQYLLLADDGGSNEGNYFATGMEYDGPVQVNKNWRFAGSPVFRMGARTASATVQMWNCTTRQWPNVNTQTSGCTTPNWGGAGLQYSAPNIELPRNAFSQKRAALGSTDITNVSRVENSEVCQKIVCVQGAPLPGVYLPSGGGIYVQGDAALTLSVSGKTQVYTITQGGVPTTVEVTNPNGPTRVTRLGVLVASRSGVPNGQLYVEGSLTSLGGPARTGALPTPLPANQQVPAQIPPAIASDTQLNVAVAGDIVVQADLTYQTNPVTDPGARNVLGLMAGSGSVRVGAQAPNNLYVHGAIVAGAAGQGLSVDNFNVGPPRGDLHLMGSLAESRDPPRGVGSIASNGAVNIVNGYGDDFHFDQRFLNGAVAPPYSAATTLFAAQTAFPQQRDWTEN